MQMIFFPVSFGKEKDLSFMRGRSVMDDELTTEEHEEGEETSGKSGTLTLDGEGWENNENLQLDEDGNIIAIKIHDSGDG